MFYYDPTYLLLIPGLLLALYAQYKVNSTFNHWKQVPSRIRMTGAQIARAILDGNGCRDVRIEPVSGSLTDVILPVLSLPLRSMAKHTTLKQIKTVLQQNYSNLK